MFGGCTHMGVLGTHLFQKNTFPTGSCKVKLCSAFQVSFLG